MLPDVTCRHGVALDVHCCNCHSGFIFDLNHECEEPMADVKKAREETGEPMLQWFEYEHLPEHLQKRSKSFAALACEIAYDYPRNPERTVALRKLLEAKDAGVRSCLG
jgi:hypothetical protein